MKKLTLILSTLLSLCLFNTSAANADVFDDHPRDGSIEINGTTYPTPLWVPEADELVIWTLTENVQAINDFMAGTGYKPVTVDGKAIVRIFFYDYKQIDLPPYKELIISFDATSVDNPVSDYPYVNEASVFLPSLLPQNTNFSYKLVLDNDDAIYYGEILYGLDKYKGHLSYQDTVANNKHYRTEQVFQKIGPHYLPIVFLAVEINDPNDQTTFFGQLAQLLGQVPSFPPVLEFHSITKDVLDPNGPLKQNNYYAVDTSPQFDLLDPAKDLVVAVPFLTPIGHFLKTLHLVPYVSYYGSDVQLVIELDN